MRRSAASKKPRSVRYGSDIPCQAVRLRDFRLIADRIINVSNNGLLVAPADCVMTGEPVIVSFRLPFWGRWIDAETTVARVMHGRRPGEQGRALGLEFDGLDDRSRRLLELTLRWLPTMPPGARPGRRSPMGALRSLAFASFASSPV